MPRRRRVRPSRELELFEMFELQVGPRVGGWGPSSDVRVHQRHLGPCSDFTCGGSEFPDEATRRRLYFANRDVLLADPQGSRPWGWWRYEGDAACAHVPPCERPPRASEDGAAVAEAVWLARHGVMEAAESAWVQSWDRGGEDIHATIGRAVREALDEASH